MPAKMSNYLENALMNRTFKAGSWTPVAQPYLALFTALTEGADGDTVTEVSGGSYTRQAISFSAAAARATENSGAVPFPTASADWGTPTYWGLYDASTSGSLLYWGQMSSPVSVDSGEVLEVAAGAIDISIGGQVSDYLAHTWLNTSLRNVAFAAPSVLRAMLLTAYTSDSVFTEVADATYARQALTVGTISNGVGSNSADIVFPAATTGYTATHGAVADAASAGNLLFRGALAASKMVAAGKLFKFLTSTLTLSID